ncbi:component of oligomeric Golgi complex 6, partial [Haematococcus lacustris]
MELMANYQEMAYDRLCRWVQGECRNIGEFDAPEVGGVLQAAVRTLAERPVLFKYCAEEVITARQTALFQRFITALTRGGPGGMPRPMELHAHDPQRYINDMLAWVHQTLAGEREFVVALFGDGAPSGSAVERSAGTRPGASSGGGVHEQARAHSGKDNGTFGPSDSLAAGEGLGAAALLDRIFESICRPLRNVGGGEELGPILAAMLDPIVEACQLSAEALLPDAPSRVDPVSSSARGAAGPWGALDPRARHVYLMNCLAYMATALGRHPCAAPRVQQLLGSVEGHVSALALAEAFESVYAALDDPTTGYAEQGGSAS